MQAETKNNRTPTNQTLILGTDIYSESHNKVQVYHTYTGCRKTDSCDQ